MKLSKWVEEEGGMLKAALKLEVSYMAMWGWLDGRGTPKVATMEKIVKLSKGRVSYQEIIDETTRKKQAQ